MSDCEDNSPVFEVVYGVSVPKVPVPDELNSCEPEMPDDIGSFNSVETVPDSDTVVHVH